MPWWPCQWLPKAHSPPPMHPTGAHEERVGGKFYCADANTRQRLPLARRVPQKKWDGSYWAKQPCHEQPPVPRPLSR